MCSLNKEEWINIYRNIESVVLLFSCNSYEKTDLIHDALLHVLKRLKTNYKEKGKFDVWVKKGKHSIFRLDAHYSQTYLCAITQ